MIVFENKDNEGDTPYLQWLDDHPDGFVLQTRKKPDPAYMNMHSARCTTIRKATNSTKASPFTAEGFIKICSLDPSDLFQYSKDHGRIAEPHIPTCCARFMDPAILRPATVAPSIAQPQPDLSLFDLSERARKTGRTSPVATTDLVQRFLRSDDVVAYAKAVANGACSLCGYTTTLNPLQFLDCHHVQFLRDRGPDTRENVVAVCPNCHRKLHIARHAEDVEKLTLLAQKRAAELDGLEPDRH